MDPRALTVTFNEHINNRDLDGLPSDRELLERLYDRFNARDMEAALATMHPDITWANGLEGGHVHPDSIHTRRMKDVSADKVMACGSTDVGSMLVQ